MVAKLVVDTKLLRVVNTKVDCEELHQTDPDGVNGQQCGKCCSISVGMCNNVERGICLHLLLVNYPEASMENGMLDWMCL